MISNAALSSRFRSMKVPIPAVPLRELFRHVLPEHAFLVCGHMDIKVSWARTLTPQPTSLDSAVEGDLVLIDTATLQQNSDANRDLTRILGQLIPAQIHAIAIQGELNISSLESAARNTMGVIYLPETASMESIERAIIRYIMERQNELKERDATLQQELARHASSNFGLHATVQILARALGLPVVLHDAHGFRLTHGLPDATLGSHHWYQHLTMLDNQDVVAHFADKTTVNYHNATILESDKALTAAVAVDSTISGYLSIVKNDTSLDSFAPLALARGATVCGLLMASMGITLNEKSRTDWLSAWLDDEAIDEPMLTARAEQSSFDPDQVYVMAGMRWMPGPDIRRMIKPVKPDQLTEQIRHETHMRRINAIIGQYRDCTVLFLPLEKAQHTGRMKQYTISIAERMNELLGGLVVCGVGRPGLGLTELRRSFSEAERAMNLTEQLWDKAHTSFFGDLSLTELLLNINNHEQLQRFCQDWLSDILDYDQQNNSDLLLTMSVYFANNGNMAATAKQLNVHRNTLVYRLNRIAEITQLDMDDADVQLNLHLAIKAYHLLQLLGLN